MKKGFIKRIAVYVAFFQLFSGSAKAGTKLVQVNNNENNPIYQRYDDETNEYSVISIFDDRNALSNQYGASQRAFDEQYFYRLLNDDLIAEELNNQLSKLKFNSLEHAQLFYKFYFTTISECGCGYAAATDFVFQLFEGREEEFYKKFGFPMYTVDYQYLDFNYELFMLKFFNYYVNKSNSFNDLVNYVNRKVYEYKISEYENKIEDVKDLQSKLRKHYKTKYYGEWSIEIVNQFKEENEEYEKQIEEYNNKIDLFNKRLKKIPYKDRRFSIPLGNTFGDLVGFLRKYGIKIKGIVQKGIKNAKPGDIIACDGYKLSERLDEYDFNSTGSHYMYITDIKEDGKVIVSSWGRKFALNNEDDLLNTRVRLKKTK